MNDKHRIFLFSTALALKKYVKDLRRIALEGEALEASGMTSRPAPLSSDDAKKLVTMLNEAEHIIDELVAKTNPGIKDEPSVSLTYIWVSIILGKMETAVENIKPENLERTRGMMPNEFKTYLEDRVKTLLKIIRDLRSTYTTDIGRKT